MKQMKSIKQLAREITKREGLKKQVNIAQVSEILAVLSDLMFEDFKGRIEWLLIENGQKRAEKKK